MRRQAGAPRAAAGGGGRGGGRGRGGAGTAATAAATARPTAKRDAAAVKKAVAQGLREQSGGTQRPPAGTQPPPPADAADSSDEEGAHAPSASAPGGSGEAAAGSSSAPPAAKRRRKVNANDVSQGERIRAQPNWLVVNPHVAAGRQSKKKWMVVPGDGDGDDDGEPRVVAMRGEWEALEATMADGEREAWQKVVAGTREGAQPYRIVITQGASERVPTVDSFDHEWHATVSADADRFYTDHLAPPQLAPWDDSFAAELARRRGTVRLGVTNPWDEKWRVGRGATTNYANEPIESDRDLLKSTLYHYRHLVERETTKEWCVSGVSGLPLRFRPHTGKWEPLDEPQWGLVAMHVPGRTGAECQREWKKFRDGWVLGYAQFEAKKERERKKAAAKAAAAEAEAGRRRQRRRRRQLRRRRLRRRRRRRRVRLCRASNRRPQRLRPTRRRPRPTRPPRRPRRPPEPAAPAAEPAAPVAPPRRPLRPLPPHPPRELVAAAGQQAEGQRVRQATFRRRG